MYQSYPAFCIPSRNTHSAIVPLARLHRRENSRSRSSNTSEDRPSRMVSITTNTNDQHPVASLSPSLLPLPLSLISPHTLPLPHLFFNLQLLYPPDPCCLFHQTRIGLSPPQPRPASSRFSTSFAPQGRKSESEIITVGSADII